MKGWVRKVFYFLGMEYMLLISVPTVNLLDSWNDWTPRWSFVSLSCTYVSQCEFVCTVTHDDNVRTWSLMSSKTLLRLSVLAERCSTTHGGCAQLRPCDTTAREPALAACAWTLPVLTLHSSALLSKWSSTTVSVRVDPAAVRCKLASSTMFCIHGWSSGAGYAVLNHWWLCFYRRQSTCLEQSSSPLDLHLSWTFSTFITYLKSHLFNIFSPSIWLYHRLFLCRALEAACGAYASIILSLSHYLTWFSDWL